MATKVNVFIISSILVYTRNWQFCRTETLKIGAIFDAEDRICEKAFRLAVKKINQKFVDRPIEPLVDYIPQNDPFKAKIATCRLITNNVVAILAPSNPENSHMVQTICDNKDIPVLDVRWSSSSLLNFYPHQNVLSQVYVDLLKAWNYEDFVILYENDSSLKKVAEMLRLYDKKGRQIIVRKLDKYRNGNYRPTLKEVWRSEITHFVLDCSSDILEEVLLQAQQVGLLTNKQFYFVTNLDFHTHDLSPFQHAETNITGMRFIDPDSDQIQTLAVELYQDEIFQNISFALLAPWKLQLESALIIDAIMMFGEALNLLPKNFSKPRVDCSSAEAWLYGTTLTNLIKGMKYFGYTGFIQFDTKGYRSSFALDVFELKEGGITTVGNWSSYDGLRLNRISPPEPPPTVEGSLVNKTFIVITCLTEPYGMRKESSVPLYGNDRYEGFGIDLIAELSQRLGFNYTFIIRDDKKNGEYDETSGQWTGMIGDVISGKADLAITDLTITSEREAAVDFTTNFMSLGISILYQKPKKATPSFFSFADPFATDVWKLLAAAFFGVSIALFILGRCSPSEWQNPYPCIEEPEYLVNQLSLRNCFWFMAGSLMQQGSEIAPIAMSTRMLAGIWWFFTLIMVSSYTANLAAFLTTESPDNAFRDVFELVQVAEKKGIKFGAKINGSTEKFFRDSKHIEEYQTIYRYMKEHEDEVMVKDNNLGVLKAEQENYAFFMETTSIEYETQRRCSLTSVGSTLDEKGYGIAMRKNSSYRWSLSTTILKLQEDGVLAKLKRKWWEERRGGGQCPDDDEKSTEGTPLNLKNVGGVFWVTIIGTLLSIVFVFAEMILHNFKRSILTKKSFKLLLSEDLNFYFRKSGMTKPVIYDRSEGSSNKTECSKKRPYGFIAPE